MYGYVSYNNTCVINRLTLFRRALDAEMKDATSEALHVKNKKTRKKVKSRSQRKKKSYSGI